MLPLPVKSICDISENTEVSLITLYFINIFNVSLTLIIKQFGTFNIYRNIIFGDFIYSII